MTAGIEEALVPLRNPAGRCRNVLVVDDDKHMRSLLQIHLAKAGYGVALAEDAIAARRLFRRFAADLLIIDVQLPYRNGMDLVSHLLAGSEVPSIPVVFISSYGQFASTARVLGAGFLLKPFHTDELLDAVSSSLAVERPAQLRDLAGKV
jgi:two-component system response regulator VicR